MSNEILKYDAELNTIPLRKFTPTEMNLFFSIVSRMQNQGDTVVRFTFDQLKDLSAYKATANTRFIDDLERTYDHLMDLRFGRRSKNGLRRERFVMFTAFDINGNADVPYVDIQVHPKAVPLINNLDTWVRASLTNFRELKSSYSKTMFRLLKQYRTTGFATFTKDDLYELLDVPDSYKPGDFDRRVLKPIKEELSGLFKGLRVTKKYGKGRGKPVIGYTFTFKKEANDADDFSKGGLQEKNDKLHNIQNNSSLTVKEQEAAVRRVIGIFEDLPKWLKDAKKREEHPEPADPAQIAFMERRKATIARSVTQVQQMIDGGQRLTNGDKKQFQQLKDLYVATTKEIKDAKTALKNAARSEDEAAKAEDDIKKADEIIARWQKSQQED